MKNLSICRFLADTLISEAVAIAAYILLLQFLNLVTEGDLLMSTGALSDFGWYAEDVAPAMRVVLGVAGTLFDVVVFLLFYAVSLWHLSRSRKRRDEYLSAIGIARFDLDTCRRTHMRGNGMRASVYFAGFLALCMGLEAIGIPFMTLPITAQRLLCHSTVSLILPIGLTKKIVLFFVVLLINTAVYAAYQWYVVPRVYEKWAGERLRVEN